jgi:hypothetical protein
MLLSRRSIICVASSKKPDNPVVAARKAFEKRRMTSVKENFNKLVVIATADAKEVTDFLKELDEIHKKALMPKSELMATSSNSSGEGEEDNTFLQ